MGKIVSYERESDGRYKCEVCITYPVKEDNAWIEHYTPPQTIYYSQEELDYRLWKQSMRELNKLSWDDENLLDEYVDKLVLYYLKLNAEERENNDKIQKISTIG
jgi:hypothetical protein